MLIAKSTLAGLLLPPCSLNGHSGCRKISKAVASQPGSMVMRDVIWLRTSDRRLSSMALENNQRSELEGVPAFGELSSN